MDWNSTARYLTNGIIIVFGGLNFFPNLLCSTLILGFSRQIVELLNQHGAKYSHFDILTDNDVRQG